MKPADALCKHPPDGKRLTQEHQLGSILIPDSAKKDPDRILPATQQGRLTFDA